MNRNSIKFLIIPLIMSFIIPKTNIKAIENNNESANSSAVEACDDECVINDDIIGDLKDAEDLDSIFSAAINPKGELNWYYVSKGKGNPSECPRESFSFLKENDAFYLKNTDEKVIYLTFDEGYENGNTPKILDTLKELNIPAAFFVVKPYIDKEPELIKRMADEGHIVGNHSVHHPSMAQITDPSKFKAEFTGVEDAYKRVTGKEMKKYFRPPMGKYSQKSLEMTKELGYKTIFWSFAYKDWLIHDQPSDDFAVKKITNGSHPGCIMLLHAVSDTNAKILKSVLSQLKDEGYEFKSLDEL
ncbi:delta-lactam-biosynthetic de-N-acetylase [Clostridium sp. BJN0001]|uniref:delta-lactam-biosynthetic de-N-acetylase n=1 Tax=Clostridium sp. BJN0001 TaxID=2930219 RepID=UPI001FD50E26|nr:delta-lactam-biosynthetic de-N-acetylase [Clostridium sp. BJN0001]